MYMYHFHTLVVLVRSFSNVPSIDTIRFPAILEAFSIGLIPGGVVADFSIGFYNRAAWWMLVLDFIIGRGGGFSIGFIIGRRGSNVRAIVCKPKGCER